MSISQAEGGTRSGLLWEVERILDELKSSSIERDLSTLPQILLMENVPQVLTAIDDFNKWINKLESLGYTNFFKVLNSKDYYIPQNRQRCFMISVLGDLAYDFPLKVGLKYRLKDFLEKEVDEKYYLSQRMVDYITNTNEKWTSNNNKALVNRDIDCTINTAPSQRRCDASNYIAEDLPENTDLRLVINGVDYKGTTNGHQSGNVYGEDGIAPTLTACDYKSPPKVLGYSDESLKRIQNNVIEEEIAPTITANAMQSVNHQNCGLIKIRNATKQGYLEAGEGDRIDISSRMDTHRGTVQKGLAQTLTTMGGNDVGVVVKNGKEN